MSGVTLTGGSGTHGGAIQSIRASRSKLERCLLTGNVASGIGGGLYSVQTFWKIIDTTISDNVSGSAGGGIGHSSALLHVEGSTISGNRVEGGTGRGGGIDHTGSLSIWNSTVSGNRALGSGAGIYLNAGSPHEMKNVTITNNLADSDGDGSGTGGGLFVATNAAVDIGDTIIADNRASTTGFDDCAGDGDVVSLGHNLFRDASGCAITGDVADDTSGVDPRLGPLEFNGGFTDTHYPLINSAAVDGGDPNGCTDPFGSPLSLDQRAEPRPTDGDGNGSAICDIGAVETLPEPSQILLAAAALASLAALARRGVGA